MERSSSGIGGHLIAALLGATASPLGAVVVTRAIPPMMIRTKSGMMAQIGAEGCDLEEM